MYDLHKPWKYKVMVVQYCGSLMDKDGSYLREEWFWDELKPPCKFSSNITEVQIGQWGGVGHGGSHHWVSLALKLVGQRGVGNSIVDPRFG